MSIARRGRKCDMYWISAVGKKQGWILDCASADLRTDRHSLDVGGMADVQPRRTHEKYWRVMTYANETNETHTRKNTTRYHRSIDVRS